MTPSGNATPEKAKTRGSKYNIMRCCLNIGLALVSGDMFLETICSCVTNWDAVIRTTIVAAMIMTDTLTDESPAISLVHWDANESCRGASPNRVAEPKLFARTRFSGPTPALACWASLSTENRAKKMGICSNRGRQELSGFVPVRL